jgi:hypothetical protein
MTTGLILVLAITATAVFYVVLPVIAHAFTRYRRARALPCPETGNTALVQIEAGRAALTSAVGAPDLRVEDCSLWPARKDCAQACVQHR